MSDEDLLKGKKILVVDDEPDVLAIIESLLPMCHVETAETFESAKELLESRSFDLAILDIMGVDGYKLLDIAKKKGVLPVMLTAHALSVDDTIRSFKSGAASYLPKDRMKDIEKYLRDILEAKAKGKSFWWRWLENMEGYYDKKFGPDWKKKDEDFWRKFPSW